MREICIEQEVLASQSPNKQFHVKWFRSTRMGCRSINLHKKISIVIFNSAVPLEYERNLMDESESILVIFSEA